MLGDDLEIVGEEAPLISMATRLCAGGADRKAYSRSEMEALRYIDVDSQGRRWDKIFSCMEAVIAREYRGLRVRDDQMKGKQGKFAGKHDYFRSVGEMNLLNKLRDLGIYISSDNSYGETWFDNENCMDKEVAYCESNNTWEYEIDDNDDDYDSEDEFNSIQKLAFLVEGEPDFDSGPPLDGFEYLRRVRWEASQIPKVMVAQLKTKFSGEQTPYMPSIPDIAECPPNLLPSKHWEDAFLVDFSKLRQEFSEYKNSRNQPVLLSTDDSLNLSVCRQKPKGGPTLSAILAMDATSRAFILQSCIRSFEASSLLSRADCLWMYALSATVDAPLDADTCASMRCMLRKCSSLLATKSDIDDEVAMLSILIAISGKYFRQSENR